MGSQVRIETREKELQTLEERGYVVIENALTQPEIQSLLAHVDDLSTWICTIGDPRENGRLNVEASDDLSVVQLRKIQCSLDICPVMQKLSLSEATLGTVEALAGARPYPPGEFCRSRGQAHRPAPAASEGREHVMRKLRLIPFSD